MAEASAAKKEEGPSLGDFFKSKGKKKIKASNLNKETTTTKEEDKKKKTKSTEDDAWEEEQVVRTEMKVEVAGKLMREEEKKDEEDTTAPAWGSLSKEKKEAYNTQNERRFPSLAKSVGSINIDDGSDGKVNITTSKNHFAALEGDEGSDEEASTKRPKMIKPAMVSKKQGEFVKSAIEREVTKYTTKKKKAKQPKGEGEDEEEDEEEEEEEDEEAPAEEEGRKEKLPKKKLPEKKDKDKDDEKDEEEELEEDLKIQPDLVASKEKYKGRKKLPAEDLPAEELEEQKENKPRQQVSGKKKKFVLEEEGTKKLAYADW